MKLRAAPMPWLIAIACAGCLGREVVGSRGEPEAACRVGPVFCSESSQAPDLGPFPEEWLTPPAAGCAGWAALDGLPSARPAVLACVEVTLDIPAGTTVIVEEAVFENVRLHVRGAEGTGLVLSASVGSHLEVTLEGHAWLVVDGGSAIDGLWAEALPAMEGSVVTIGDADVSRFAIQVGPRAELRLEGARLEEGAIDAGDLVSAEAMMTDVHLRAGKAIFAETRGTRVHAELAEARVLDTSFTESEIARCGSLRLLRSTLERSSVVRCDVPVTLAGSTLVGTTVHGAVESSGSSIKVSWLRPGPETLFFADSRIDGSAFCGTEHLVAHSGSIACVSCDPPIPDIEIETTYVHAPDCPSLEAAAAGAIE